MALAPFFERIYGAVGGHLSISRESLITKLGQTTVGIRCGGNLDLNDQWIAELTVNLVARLYPRISLLAASNTDNLKLLARSINPEIEIVSETVSDSTICIGEATAPGALYPTASGWVGRLNHRLGTRSGAANPYASGLAATLACSELFRRIFQNSQPERDCSISLLDYGAEAGEDSLLAPHDLGRVVFAGIGAVGNAAVWALARDSSACGRLILVDPETLTSLNLQRYILGTVADVSKYKVNLAVEALGQSEHLSLEPVAKSLEQFADELGTPVIPTICVSVDNIPTRRAAQALLPRLVVNGWTGDAALGVSWHRFSRDAACLACLYHPRGQGLSAIDQASKSLGIPIERTALLWISRQGLSWEDIENAARTLGVSAEDLAPWRGRPVGELYTDVVCGTVSLDVKGIGHLEAVPLAHQSVLAGILMATELIKRTNPELNAVSQEETLVSWDNILASVPRQWQRPAARVPGCICADSDYQAVYRERWESVSDHLD